MKVNTIKLNTGKTQGSKVSFKQDKHLYTTTQALFTRAIAELKRKGGTIQNEAGSLIFDKIENQGIKIHRLKVHKNENGIDVVYYYNYHSTPDRKSLVIIREANDHGQVMLSPERNERPETVAAYNNEISNYLLQLVGS